MGITGQDSAHQTGASQAQEDLPPMSKVKFKSRLKPWKGSLFEICSPAGHYRKKFLIGLRRHSMQWVMGWIENGCGLEEQYFQQSIDIQPAGE